MECKFWVGQRVVCVDLSMHPIWGGSQGELPALVVGAVYTVRQIGHLNTVFPDLITLRVAEYCHGPLDDGLGPWRFRPATDITIFKEIVAKVKDRDLIPAGAMR